MADRERLAEVMAQGMHDSNHCPSDNPLSWLPEAKGSLAALESAGFRVFRLHDAPRMWWCAATRIDEEGAVQGVLPGSSVYDLCKRFGGRGHSGCGWVRVVKEDN